MKIIITGYAGLIGSGLFNYYSRGHNVIGIDRNTGHDLLDDDTVTEFFYDNHADVLINAFGLNHHITNNDDVDVYHMSIDQFNEYHEINNGALFNVCRKYAAHNMRGCVINFGSMYSHIIPDPDLSTKHSGYISSKHAVIGLTKYMAKYMPHIRFNAICPGGIYNNQPKTFVDKYINKCLIKRMCSIKDIIRACDFLIESDYITGQSIMIDGGFSL